MRNKAKTCTKCGKTYPASPTYFYPEPAGKWGFASKCRQCEIKKAKEMRRRKPNAHNDYKRKNPRRYWSSSTLSGHRCRGIKIEIALDDLERLAKSTDDCPICGVVLQWERGLGFCGNSPTLDRVDNDGLLNMNNCQIICLRCNITKGNRTWRQFIDYCWMVTAKFA